MVDAGWITSERTSPMLATWLCSSSALTKALPASMPPASSKDSTAPVPLGARLLPRSYQGELGQPGVVDDAHLVAAGEELGDPLGVGDVALDPQAQRLQSLGDQEGVERARSPNRGRAAVAPGP